jgi:uncharacterized protein YgiM (DUF1202 family)
MNSEQTPSEQPEALFVFDHNDEADLDAIWSSTESELEQAPVTKKSVTGRTSFFYHPSIVGISSPQAQQRIVGGAFIGIVLIVSGVAAGRMMLSNSDLNAQLQPPVSTPASNMSEAAVNPANFVREDGVNLRANPGKQGIVISTLAQNTPVIVSDAGLQVQDQLQWAKVTVPDLGLSGWVANNLIAKNKTSEEILKPAFRVVIKDNSTVYKYPSFKSESITSVNIGQKYLCSGRVIKSEGNSWIHAEFIDGTFGWMPAEYLGTFEQDTEEHYSMNANNELETSGTLEATVPETGGSRVAQYTIESEEKLPPFKAVYVIRIPRAYSESEITSIAKHIRQQMGREFERIFMFYLTPGMIYGNGAYATTHYTPDLKVQVSGLSEEKLSNLRNNDTYSPLAIGHWSNHHTPSVMSILKTAEGYLMQEIYSDGDRNLQKLLSKDLGGQLVFSTTFDEADGYYTVENQNLVLKTLDGQIVNVYPPLN